MLVLVAYDIATSTEAGPRRLNAVARAVKDYGVRVQKSLWECDVDPARWERLRTRLLHTFDEDTDSLRFYFLGSNWERRVEHHGAHPPPDVQGLLLVE